MQGKPENDFLPMPDDSVKADIIYLCSPNNPTGAVYTKEQLEKIGLSLCAGKTMRLFFMMPHTNPLSATLKFRAAFFAVEGAQKMCN